MYNYRIEETYSYKDETDYVKIHPCRNRIHAKYLFQHLLRKAEAFKNNSSSYGIVTQIGLLMTKSCCYLHNNTVILK